MHVENIVFSDGLKTSKAVELSRACRKAGIGCSMGVGTFFTNDFVHKEKPDKSNTDGSGPIEQEGEGSKALNM